MAKTFRWIGFVFLVLLLLITAFSETVQGLRAIRYPEAAGWRLVGTAQLLYGICAILTLVTLGARHRTANAFMYAWCAGSVVVSGLASVIYGSAPIGAGVASSVGALVLCVLLLWIWRHRPGSMNG